MVEKSQLFALPFPSKKTHRQALPAADSFLRAEVMLDLPFCFNNKKKKKQAVPLIRELKNYIL